MHNLVSNASSPKVLSTVFNYIKTETGKENLSGKSERLILDHIKIFCGNLITRWRKCHQCEKRFLKKYSVWLQRYLMNSDCDIQVALKIGRPEKPFIESCAKTQKRRVTSLAKSKSPEELALATQISYRAQGKRNIAKQIGQIVMPEPSSSSEKSKSEPMPYTPMEALALIVDLKLTKYQYVSMQKGAAERNVNLYPPYYLVLKAKNECYPNNINILENFAEVKLQSLLDHTCDRLVQVQDEVFTQTFQNTKTVFCQLNCKWGLDGSGGHANYKQNFSGQYGSISDSDVLLTSLVPLNLVYKNEGNEEVVIWQNPRTSSTRFCRPIKIQFIKETAEVISSEVNNIKSQISNLTPTKVTTSFGHEIYIKHYLCLTMLDGKACNAVIKNSSSQTCYICGARPKEMNNLSHIKDRPLKDNAYELGLSTLHAHIRFFECVLHISYRLGNQKWQIRKDGKAAFETRKKEIIDKLKLELGLLVDVVKQGYGSTNDGNTARRFFQNCDKASEITGVDKDLLNRFNVILQTLSSGFSIKTNEFKIYLFETAERFVFLYPWYYMPASLHKILLHGADIISSFDLPIGQLSEDVQEARHKEYRHYREHNTRKTSRVETNTDLFHMFLISSDPLISSIRKLPNKKESVLSPEALRFLKCPDLGKL